MTLLHPLVVAYFTHNCTDCPCIFVYLQCTTFKKWEARSNNYSDTPLKIFIISNSLPICLKTISTEFLVCFLTHNCSCGQVEFMSQMLTNPQIIHFSVAHLCTQFVSNSENGEIWLNKLLMFRVITPPQKPTLLQHTQYMDGQRM